MERKICKGCEEEFDAEEEDLLEYPEDSGNFYCTDCAWEMANTCPRCGGHGCNYCLMVEW